MGLYGVGDASNLGEKCINKLYKRPKKKRDHFLKRLLASPTPQDWKISAKILVTATRSYQQ